ncbi:MAG: glutamate formimidoyltransferase [Deltaproteobacteria bacterium]|nr:glutamate formimidoyltransferase [Deltaproteobacteria bacterium]
MSARLVECVPNFSEGRNREVIEAIASQIRGVAGVTLLDVDAGEATHRTVMTFVGEPGAVAEAAFRAIRKASELIDMRVHRGAHPRQGATDVCPLVPVSEVTTEECVALAHALAERVGRELAIPVYLYEAAATRPERRSLTDLRAGEYEALAEKLRRPEWAPDYGPSEFHARAGATVVGVRPFLIAYNVNLATQNVKLAKEIGLAIREAGRAARDERGEKVYGADGELVRVPGLPCCKATGWYIAEYGRAQVTMNLTDYEVTPPHIAFDRVVELASGLGVRVTGSEIVGLVPRRAVLMAGEHYLRKQRATTGVSEDELVRAARLSLGLDDVAAFDPRQKIIEYRVAEGRPLVGRTVAGFVDDVASSAPTPGGGSVAALSGALAASLTAMVAALSHGRSADRELDARLEEWGRRAQELKAECLAAVDEDTAAFNALMAAARLPKVTAEQQDARASAVREATRWAAAVPLAVLERCPELLELASAVAREGNPNAVSDAGVAGLVARAGASGALYNVIANLKDLDDPLWSADARRRTDEASERVETLSRDLHRFVVERLSGA